MTSANRRDLVRESKWMRVFTLGDEGTYLYESKFLVDDLRIAAAEVYEIWVDLSPDEQLEFASAFSCQPPRDSEDQKILEYLIKVGSEKVWRSIANLIPFLWNRHTAVAFLTDRCESALRPRANYYQALSSLEGDQAISLLRKESEKLRGIVEAADASEDRVEAWIDYVQCLAILWKLSHESTAALRLEECVATIPPELQSMLRTILEQMKHS